MRTGSIGARFTCLLLVIAGLFATGSSTLASDCRGNEPDSPGLISDTEYEGPIFGNEVSWDDIWEVGEMSNEYVAQAVGEFYQPVDCEGNTGDRLTLVHRLSPSTVLTIQTFQVGMWTFDSMVEDMSHPGWTTNLGLPQGSEVLFADSTDDSLAMLARDPEDASHFVYKETFFPEDAEGIMTITLHIWDPDAASAVLSDLRDVDIDGFDVFSVESRRNVVEYIEEAG